MYGHKLTTAMIRTKSFEGYPVLQMLSMDEKFQTCKTFFECLREISTTAPKVLVSDDFSNYINAAKSVFSSDIELRLCVWHIYRSWKSKVVKYESSKENNTMINLIRLQKALDSTEFSNLLNVLFSQCTKKFREYFEKFYLPRKQAWSSVFRKRMGVNTNMVLESMHNQLKKTVLNRRSNKRMDEFIHLHFEFISNYKIKFTGSITTSTKVKEFHRQHHKSSSINVLSWNTDGSANYTDGHSTSIVAESPCCPLICRICDHCIHQFECTCFEFQVKCNICCHCHVLAKEMRANSSSIRNRFQQHENVFEPEPATSLPEPTISEAEKFEMLLQTITSKSDELKNSKYVANINSSLEHILEFVRLRPSNKIQPKQRR